MWSSKQCIFRTTSSSPPVWRSGPKGACDCRNRTALTCPHGEIKQNLPPNNCDLLQVGQLCLAAAVNWHFAQRLVTFSFSPARLQREEPRQQILLFWLSSCDRLCDNPMGKVVCPWEFVWVSVYLAISCALVCSLCKVCEWKLLSCR